MFVGTFLCCLWPCSQDYWGFLSQSSLGLAATNWIYYLSSVPNSRVESCCVTFPEKQTFNPVKALMTDQRNESTRIQGTYESITAIYWLTQMQLCHWKTYHSLGNNSWKLNPWSSLHEFPGCISGQRVSCMQLSQW